MSHTTTTQPQRGLQPEEAMKIHHITYEESHDSLPTLNKRLSASKKVRSFISRRLSRNFDTPQQHLTAHHEEGERPTTLFPRFGGSKDSLAEIEKGDTSEMTGYLVQRHRIEKEARKKEKVLSSANSSGSYLPLTSPTGCSSTKSKSKSKSRSKPKGNEKGVGMNESSFSISSLKKKNTFSDLVKEMMHRKVAEPRAAQKQRLEEKGDNMEKIYNLRKAMVEGKLERVIPPPSANTLSGQDRRPPPRPAHNAFLDNISSAGSVTLNQPGAVMGQVRVPDSRTSLQSVRPNSRMRKTKSAGSRIASLIGSSADLMDETRRGIQGRLKEAGGGLGYPSFSLGRREGDGDSDGDSDESFFCGSGLGVGGVSENETGMLMRKERVQMGERERPKTRGKGSERGGRENRIPGEEVVKKCKLCGLGIVSSTRGLCAECEADFLPLRTEPPAVKMASKIAYSDSEYEDDIVGDDNTDEEDEIPPTLPLKIRKQVVVTKEPDRLEHDVLRTRNPFAFQDSDSEDERPAVPPKDDIVLGLSLPNKTYKPPITPRNPARQSSQRAQIETEMVNETQSAMKHFSSGGWQSDGLSPTYEEAQRMLDRWSDCFGDGAVEGMRGQEDNEDGVPLVRAMDCDGVKRDSEFYRFWDEVLKEHAPRTSRGAGVMASTGADGKRRR
ncbi:hypothetical protein BKA65DRAFT_553115 [Rhexocercosporidium sp. MPI-PUGE-AT-0058]|nr:hypothetical protein BKA65DRAFT_553115 [Rhexocercosporidium sp. MPI-PUGE-AT-0058]